MKHQYTIAGQPLTVNHSWDLGTLSCSQEEVIEFAKMADPLPIHVDPEAARKSHFGRLIAPGSMLYSWFHKYKFIPMFNSSIVCGINVERWAFLHPHIPDREYRGTLKILELDLRPEKGMVSILWHFQFRDQSGELIQEVKITILHKLDPL